jgi:GrpB-like predicted nucleotidyltransferase (UPF0157 family)
VKTNPNTLTAEQIGKLFPIRIVPYNPDWEALFEKERVVLIEALGQDSVLNIEHFGSTSVEGLAAKPTIDILVEVPDLNDEIKQAITEKLNPLGYGNMHNAEKENEMTFGKGYDENYTHATSYHVHIRQKGHTKQDEIYFRDYLRQNIDARDAYAKLKHTLAQKHQFNREDYTQAKSEFVIKYTELQKNIKLFK